MIITITGKPCSGKTAVLGFIAENYNFKSFKAGEIFRQVATERNIDILELNRLKDTSIDKFVDDKLVEIGKIEKDNDVIIDSRTAWHFVPHSFKVFIDVDPEVQVKRIMNSQRTDEKISMNTEQALKDLEERWNLENERYMALYGFDNKDFSSYDYVINNSNLTIEQTGEKIMQAYFEFVKNNKK